MAYPASRFEPAPEERRALASCGLTPEQCRRLDFARWLVRTGRLDDGQGPGQSALPTAPRPPLRRALAAVLHRRP